jgi:riboflavin synthase
MFTGLIQSVGTVSAVADDGHGGKSLRIFATLSPTPAVGASVCVDGACLTVAEKAGDAFTFQVGPETLAKSTLGRFIAGDRVNLEPALRVGDPLGGHFVTGHVDCVGSITEVVESGDWRTYRFSCPAGFDDLLVMKGSVAVDGISLTVAETGEGKFGCMLVPHTLAHTTLSSKAIGDAVNLEFDPIAKHVRKLFKTLTVTI